MSEIENAFDIMLATGEVIPRAVLKKLKNS